jgi:hypothetical protein
MRARPTDAGAIHPLEVTGIPQARLARETLSPHAHRSLGADLRRQALAPLGSTTLQDCSTSRRTHPRTKPVGALATNTAGLVGTLHWGRSWSGVVGALKARERTGIARMLSRQLPVEQRNSVEWW